MGEESGCRVPGLCMADNSLALSRAPGASPKDSSPQSMCRGVGLGWEKGTLQSVRSHSMLQEPRSGPWVSEQ